MTDNEIKKALECCKKSKKRGDCEELGCPACVKEGCAYYIRTDEDYEGVVFAEIAKDLVDLLNRQQAEVESVTKRADMWHREAELNAFELIKMQADNERLKKLLEEADVNYNKCAKRFYKEAVKEFAENYKTEINERYEDIAYKDLFFGVIDYIVKEMVGDAE